MTVRSAPAVVLCYHRVREAPDPLDLSVTPDHFRDQLAHLRSVADIVPADQVGEPSGRPRLAITFDDGYADNLEAAAPLLLAEDAPATFFYTSIAVDGGGDFWWERLDHLVLDAVPPVSHLDLALGSRRVRVDVRSPAGRQRAHAVLNRYLLECAPDEQGRVLDAVGLQVGRDADACSSHTKISEAEVQALLAHDLFDLGGHTVSHPVLSRLPRREQEREVGENLARMSELAGHPVRSFAYPYGYAGSFDDDTVEILRAAGYERAFTTVPGRVEEGTDPFRIPRVGVLDEDGAHLVRRLEAWLV